MDAIFYERFNLRDIIVSNDVYRVCSFGTIRFANLLFSAWNTVHGPLFATSL